MAPVSARNVISVASVSLLPKAQALFTANDQTAALTLMDPQALQATCAQVDAIFTDADGTVVEEGHTVLAPDYSSRIEALAHAGVVVTLVTGKPYAEIAPLVNSLPKSLPLQIIYEKGAYYLKPAADGTLHKEYLLSTPELETSVAELRQIFSREKAVIEQHYTDSDGQPQVFLGWAGSGSHESVLSIDILVGHVPDHYLTLVGAGRDALKVKDPNLLAQVEADLQRLTDHYRPGWRLVHLGNGNSEIAPGPIEKDIAIAAMPTFKAARRVLVLGDSGNDRQMFGLRSTSKVLAGLVVARDKSLELVNDVDMMSFGMANARPLLDLVLTARS